MDKVKIQEIAYEVGLSNGELLYKAKELGFNVKEANSNISMEDAGILVDYVISGILPKSFKKPDKKSKITMVRKKFDETSREENSTKIKETLPVKNEIPLGKKFDVDDYRGFGNAIVSNNINKVKECIKQGADISYINKTGGNALHAVASLNRPQIAELLIQNTDYDRSLLYVQNKNGEIPLTEAILKGSKEVAKIFIEQMTDLDNENKHGYTALLLSTQSKDYELAKLLIEKGADVNSKTRDGKTALIYSIQNNNYELAKLLIEKNVNVNIKDSYEKTALIEAHNYLAIHNFDDRFIKLLLNVENVDTGSFKKFVERYMEHDYKIIEFLNHDQEHHPKKLASLLQKFSSDKRLQFSNHDWDDSKLNYNQFKSDLEDGWKEIDEELQLLAPDLHKNIKKLLFEDVSEANIVQFGNEEITLGWSSKNLQKYNPNGTDRKPKDFKDFKNCIVKFKKSITIKPDEDMSLLDIFGRVEEYNNLDLEIDMHDLLDSNISKIYTNVPKLELALTTILSDIKDREKDAKIVVTLEEIDCHDTVELKIKHIGSRASSKPKVLQNSISRNGGNFKTIYNNLISVCDWSIDTIANNVRCRIDYLYQKEDSNKSPHCITLDDEIKGFTHILRFYQ